MNAIGAGRNFSFSMPSGDDRLVFRGLLILLVIVGHNRLITDNHRILFAMIYFWHVQGFFLEAVAHRSPDSWAHRRPADLLVRYLVPYVLVVALALFASLIQRGRQSDYSLLPLALYSGDARLLERGTGFALYWFLPTFSAFSLLLVGRARIVTAAPCLAAPLTAAFALASVALAVWPPLSLVPYMPLGLAIGVYMVPLSLLYRRVLLWSSASRSRQAVTALGATLIVAVKVAAILWTGLIVNLSIYRLGANLPDVLLEMAALVAMAYLVQRLASCIPARGCLAALGGRSMVVYLIHPFVQAPFSAILSHRLHHAGTAVTMAAGLLIVVVSTVLSMLAAMILERLPRMRALVLPKDWASWRTACHSLVSKPDLGSCG